RLKRICRIKWEDCRRKLKICDSSKRRRLSARRSRPLQNHRLLSFSSSATATDWRFRITRSSGRRFGFWTRETERRFHFRTSISAPPNGKIAPAVRGDRGDRKSTRLNSSHVEISYAVFCLKKKKKKK